MSIARAHPGPRLLSRSFARLCCAQWTSPTLATCRFSTNVRQDNNQNQPPRRPQQTWPRGKSRKTISNEMRASEKRNNTPKGGMRRVIPMDVQKFWRPGADLWTTPDMWEFFEETGIRYDTSLTRRIPLSPTNHFIYKAFHCSLNFSDEYIVNPNHLVMAQPWGHPLAEKFKSKYREKLRDEPLWIHFITYGNASMLVNNVAKRRLRQEFWSWLEKLEGEHPEQSRLKGTLIVELKDPKKAAAVPAFQFGKALAEAVMVERSQKNYDA